MNNQAKSCREEFDFQGYLDQQMILPERIRLERHMKECPSCTKRLARLEKLFQNLEQACVPTAEDRISPESLQKVMSRVGKAPMAQPAPTEDSGTLFELMNELRRLQKTLLAGFAVCAVLVLVAVGSQFFAPTSNVRPDGTIVQADTFFCSFLINEGMKKIGDTGSSSEVPAAIESGARYELAGKTHLQVSLAPTQKLDFQKAARFSVSRSGVTIETGEVTCDLGKAPGFTVKSPHGAVVTVGTIFRVEVCPEATRVTLDKGVIQLKTPRQQLEVKAPAQMQLMADGVISPIPPESVSPVSVVQPLVPVQHQAGGVDPVQGVTSVPIDSATPPVEPAEPAPTTGKTGSSSCETPATTADSINQAY